MSLLEKINTDLKSAMKDQNKGKLRALRNIKAALMLLYTEKKKEEITEAEEMKVLQKLAKQRREAVELYQSNGRSDLAKEEGEELEIILTYLPESMNEEQIRKEIIQIIQESGATSMKDMGRVMKIAMKRLAGKAEGKTVSNIVKELLTKA